MDRRPDRRFFPTDASKSGRRSVAAMNAIGIGLLLGTTYFGTRTRAPIIEPLRVVPEGSKERGSARSATLPREARGSSTETAPETGVSRNDGPGMPTQASDLAIQMQNHIGRLTASEAIREWKGGDRSRLDRILSRGSSREALLCAIGQMGEEMDPRYISMLEKALERESIGDESGWKDGRVISTIREAIVRIRTNMQRVSGL